MGRSMRLSATACVLVLLLVAIGMGPMVVGGQLEANPTTDVIKRDCEALSNDFNGICLSSDNCANICKTEGFQGGKCVGFRMRCFCTKQC